MPEYGKIVIRAMHLSWTLSERTSHDGRAADVIEGTFRNRSALDALVVEGCGTKMQELAIGEVHFAGIAYADGTHGSLYPRLVLEPFVPGQTGILLQLIGIDERKTAL